MFLSKWMHNYVELSIPHPHYWYPDIYAHENWLPTVFRSWYTIAIFLRQNSTLIANTKTCYSITIFCSISVLKIYINSTNIVKQWHYWTYYLQIIIIMCKLDIHKYIWHVCMHVRVWRDMLLCYIYIRGMHSFFCWSWFVAPNGALGLHLPSTTI